MRVHVAFTPDEVVSAPLGVVVDVLRATSTIPQALAAGYRRVLCCAQIEDAQAPYLALAQLRTRQGQLSSAFTVTIAMTGRTRSAVTDPWWIYDYGQFWDLDRRMITLRDLAAR